MKKKLTLAAQLLLGLVYFASGLAGLLHMMPPPPPNFPAGALGFMTGMMGTGYFFPLLKLTETICGGLLLANFAPALALVILAPITLNIFLFHTILTPGLQNAVIPVVMVILHIAAMNRYVAQYRPLLKKNA